MIYWLVIDKMVLTNNLHIILVIIKNISEKRSGFSSPGHQAVYSVRHNSGVTIAASLCSSQVVDTNHEDRHFGWILH